MIAIAFFALAMAVGGHAVQRRLWAVEEAGPFERALSALLCALGLAVAANWILSALRALTRGGLLGAALVVGAGGVVALARGPRPPRAKGWLAPWGLIALVPLFAWVGFVLWRGAILPVLSHDALIYHLPRAVLVTRAHGFRYFPAPDARISASPANYELLLADLLLLDGSDRLTEWLGTLAYLGLLLATAAVVERWWGRGHELWASVLVVAALPVALLHSGAHKNDLLAAFFQLAALLFAGRALARGGRAPLALAIGAAALAVGTKVYGLLLAAALVPLAAGGLWRWRPSARAALGWAALGGAALALGGGAVYVLNLAHTGSLTGPLVPPEVKLGWGDLGNLWRFPYLLLAAPFSPDAESVWVPWRHEAWWWPRYGLYTAHFGAALSFLALLGPLCLWRFRRLAPPGAASPTERHAVLGGALLFWLLAVPVRLRPLGSFNNFPRYLLCCAPIVVAATLAPLCRRLADAPGRAARGLAPALVGAASLLLLASGLDYGRNDAFAPLVYLRHVMAHPGWRAPYVGPRRAGVIVDDLAGPEDTIAVDGAFDTWFYPLYGPSLRRQVIFLLPGPGPVEIPREAKWVVVDRSFAVLWGYPELTDMGRFGQAFGRGRSPPEDLRVARALRADPAFELLDRRPPNQAVFRRVAPR